MVRSIVMRLVSSTSDNGPRHRTQTLSTWIWTRRLGTSGMVIRTVLSGLQFVSGDLNGFTSPRIERPLRRGGPGRAGGAQVNQTELRSPIYRFGTVERT